MQGDGDTLCPGAETGVGYQTNVQSHQCLGTGELGRDVGRWEGDGGEG